MHVLDEAGRTVEVSAVRPDADALRTLANRILCHGQEVSAVIESMTGSRFVHDTLERLGWEVAGSPSPTACLLGEIHPEIGEWLRKLTAESGTGGGVE